MPSNLNRELGFMSEQPSRSSGHVVQSELQRVFQKALEHHQKGELAEAIGLYQRCLKIRADHYDSAYLLAVSLYQSKRAGESVKYFDLAVLLQPASLEAQKDRGLVLKELKRFDEALASFENAIGVEPNLAELHLNRGIVLKELNRFSAALASHDRAIELQSDFAEAYNNRGNVLARLGRPDDALRSYRRAAALKPGFVDPEYNCGVTLHELKRFDEALASYDKAIALKPDYAEAYNNRGGSFIELKRFEEALASCDKAIALKPNYSEAHNNRSSSLIELKRFEEALVSCDKAIALKPDYAEAHNNRGCSLMELRRFEEAVASFDKAITLKPDYAEAYNNVGSSMKELSQFDGALMSFDKAITLKTDYAAAYINRAQLLSKLKRRDEARGDYNNAIALNPKADFLLSARLREKMGMCLWDGVEKDLSELKGLIEAGENASEPFTFLGLDDSPALQKRCAEIFVAERYPRTSGGDHLESMRKDSERKDTDKITLGYYSADFHDHPMLFLMAEVFEKHDKTRFRLVGFSFGPVDKSKMRDRILPFFDAFHDVRAMSDQQIVELSRREGVDIAVDRKGFTENSRTSLFATGLAPIQVNYLAYPGTMGADYIDYIVADPVLIPEQQREFYTEKIAYLPNSYQPNDRKRVISDRVFSRAELDLPEMAFVYCCFNNNYKITPDVFAIWMRILAQAPDSVLWLLEENPFVVKNLRAAAQKYDIDPERLIFAKRMALADHLARHRFADLFIDTLPYNAHTTASDALWAGLPVLTRMGQSFTGRVAASLLKAIGLPELVVETPADYEKLALTYYRDRDALNALKAKLKQNIMSSPLFDSEQYVEDIEQLYVQMVERQRAGLRPDHLHVTGPRAN
jgi:protein O-GlcNAc transferase